MKMKAAVLHGRRDLRYEEIDKPQAGPGEVVIRVKATGICGSDIPRVLENAAHYYPIILGHEFSGIIDELGEGVENFEVGDYVTAAPLIPCMKCADCQKGNYSLCKHYKFTGSSVFGSFADYVKVPAAGVVKFEKNVDFVQAAFFEPSTVGLHGLRQSNFKGGYNVAIVGGGTIGLFTMQWAKILGARNVAVFDISDERLEIAKKLGADVVFNTTDPDYMKKAKDFTGGVGFEYCYETAGQNITQGICFELASNKATVCFIGTASKDVTFNWKQFELMNRKEFFLTGSWMSYSAPFPGEEWTLTAECFSNGKLKYDDSMVFKKFPMEKAWDAFEMYLTPGAVKGKLMLVNED